MMRFTAFDRWGNQLGPVTDVVEAVHDDEVNGGDTLTLLLASCNLKKGDRIVWRDKFLVWHEHIVNDLKDVHEGGKLYTTAFCENSIAELFTDYIEELRPYDVTALVALQKALSTSRWVPGTVEISGTASASFYHISAREAVTEVIKAWGGELSTTITVSGAYVNARKVNILARRGADNNKRFEWTKDIKEITREVATDDVCTALYGYGKGLAKYDDDGQLTGGYERRLTFGEINGGRDYVTDETAKNTWGLPDGSGGKKHTFGKVIFPDCEDMAELLSLTREELAKRSKPRVTYKANVVDLADAGFAHEDVQAGDTVAIVDRELGERLSGRVLRVERYLYNEQATSITLGNITRSIADVMGNTQADVRRLNDHASLWDGAGALSTSYVTAVINSLNNTMNQTGGYTYYKPGEGIITYDKPEDQNPTMAIQIKGAGFRIANTKTSSGEWNWRTFGTAAGFTADEIVVGTIRGGDSWWNLATGDMFLGQGSIGSTGGSHWNLSSGEFQTIYVLDPAVSVTDLSDRKVYEQKIVLVEMSEDTPFGIYTAKRIRYEWKDGREDTYGTVWNKNFIGGLDLSGNEVYLRANRVGSSAQRYMTVGVNFEGNMGASFYSEDGHYMDINAMKSQNSTVVDGVGFASFDKPFLSANTTLKQVWLWPPVYSGTFLTKPDEQLYMRQNEHVALQRSSTRGIFMGSDYVTIKFSNTIYISITSSGVVCRCGSKGFGWHNGAFSDSLTWN